MTLSPGGAEPTLRAGPGVVAVARRAVALVELLAHGPDSHDVRELLIRHGEPTDIRIAESDVIAMTRVADLFAGLFGGDDRDAWAHTLNNILTGYASTPRLFAHDGVDWHLHLDSGPDAKWDVWFAASSAFALAVLLVDGAEVPVRRCAAHGCDRPFLPVGGGRRRRFCSSRCATRTRVAEHRRHRQT